MNSRIFFFICYLWASLSYAAPPCVAPAISAYTNQTISPEVRALFFEIPKNQIPAPFLLTSAENLFRENIEVFIKSDALAGIQVKAVRVVPIAPHPNYPYFKADLEITQGSRTFDTELLFRSNGQASFLSSTWNLEQMSRTGQLHLKAVVQGKGLSQNLAILDSLPENIKLSRSMTPQELALWKSGKVDKIKTTHLLFGSKFDSNPKTTFALNYFKFNNLEPEVFEIPKQTLLKLENEGLLSINTYEDLANSKKGMPPEARTPFGLEIELVIHGNLGRQAILPFLRNIK